MIEHRAFATSNPNPNLTVLLGSFLQEILRTAELYSPVFAGHNATDADDVMANDLVGGLMSNVSC